ncbi:MAG: uncharacterized protein K0R12_1381, partial [Gammaproteobacteria bacterium]|nr:uncharacterized protein [Gammaproteobacteria bacterium]
MHKFAWIGSSLILLFILMVLSPLCIGFYAKNKLTTAVGKLQARNPMLVVRITDYQRHWFTSTATIQLGLHPIKAAPATVSSTPLAVTVNTEIVHGPILWQKSSAQGFPLDFGLAYVSGLLQLNKDSVPLTAQWINRSDLGLIGLKFNFLGGMHLVLQWLPFVFSDPAQGLKLSVQGAVTQWWTNADVSRVRFEQNNQGVVLQSPTLEARFEQPTVLKVEQHKVNDKVWIGNVDMNIPLLQMQGAKQLPLRFDAIHLSYDTELNDRFLNTKTNIHIDNVKRGDEDTYRGLIIEASADHLDLSAVQAILQLSQQLNAALSEMNALIAKRGQSSDAQSSAIEAAYIDSSKQVFLVQQQFFLAVTQLLKEGAQFSIKQFHLGTPQGDLDGAFSVAFAKAPADKPLLGLVQAVNNAAIQMNFALPKLLMQTVLT